MACSSGGSSTPRSVMIALVELGSAIEGEVESAEPGSMSDGEHPSGCTRGPDEAGGGGEPARRPGCECRRPVEVRRLSQRLQPEPPLGGQLAVPRPPI